MATGLGRYLRLPAALGAALLATGCAQSGPLASRNTMLGSLKASVSQLEFDNEKLRSEVAELKADNARLDNQLAQEREANGEITARLDDAKDLLRRAGNESPSLGARAKSLEDDGIPPPVRRSKGGRKPPAAQIRRVDPEPLDPLEDKALDSTSNGPSRDLGPADREDDRWLPVARGPGSPSNRR